MTAQLALFVAPAARRFDPPASHTAARQFRPRAGSHRARILAALEACGQAGGTHRELSVLTGLDPVAIDRRLPELRRLGLVVRLALTRGEPGAHVHVLRQSAP